MKRDVVWLTDREYRYLNVLAAVAVPAFVLANQPWLDSGRRSRLVLSAFGIGFAFALWMTGRMRHRLWAAFASFLMIFGPWSFLFIGALPYIAFAFWLLSRAGRDLKKEPPAPT